MRRADHLARIRGLHGASSLLTCAEGPGGGRPAAWRSPLFGNNFRGEQEIFLKELKELDCFQFSRILHVI